MSGTVEDRRFPDGVVFRRNRRSRAPEATSCSWSRCGNISRRHGAEPAPVACRSGWRPRCCGAPTGVVALTARAPPTMKLPDMRAHRPPARCEPDRCLDRQAARGRADQRGLAAGSRSAPLPDVLERGSGAAACTRVWRGLRACTTRQRGDTDARPLSAGPWIRRGATDRSAFLCLCVTAFGWALNWPLMKLCRCNCGRRCSPAGLPARAPR